MPARKILVLGATGVIGKVLVEALLCGKEHFDSIGIFTSAESATNKQALIESFKSRGVSVVIGDLYNDDQVLEAYRDYDTVVSALGRYAIDKQVDLIALAERSSTIARFIPSEYGTDIAYDATSVTEMPHQKKLKVRKFLESGAISRLKYTYLVVGPFADLYVGNMAQEPEMGSFDPENKKATLLGEGTEQISLTTMADVGRLLVGVLRHPEVCDNKAIKVNSFTTTPNAILAEFERQTNSKWNVEYTSIDQLRQLEKKAYEDQNSLSSLYTLRRIWTEGRTLYEKRDNESIGLTKMDTLEMVIQQAVANPVSAFQSGKL
ncbi:unnamed protein product [Clonostachys rosea]|uniref:NmrA-like domain-containing protein n=1 Tax=Bionectria ochroleuca TaxID=29856 RepID=A0ABY6TQV8_BIOOC|nr:unnamed protein product [Clonostachys rosea]